MRTLVALLLLVASVPNHDTRIAKIESNLLPPVRVKGRTYTPTTIEAAMKKHNVPAVSVAVIDGGKIAWTKAYGTAKTNTLFQAASISKPIAASAALRLADKGKLSLDTPVNDLLRSWKLPNGEKVTLRHLFSHTAGTNVHGFPGYASGKPVPTVLQILEGQTPANTAAVKVEGEPGAAWRYSGGGITVAQLALTDVAGKPFPKLMKELVLDPVGMKNSTFDKPRGDVARGHNAKGEPVPGGHHTYPELAAAGLWTTPTDLAKWLLALNGEKFLSKQTVEQMLTPGPGNWGIGIAVRGKDDAVRISHAGTNEGYRAEMISFPRRGQGAVIMTNSDNGDAVMSELMMAIATEYGWPGYAPREVVPYDIPVATLREFVGRYVTEGTPIELGIELEEDRLYFIGLGGTKRELIATAPDTFGGIKFERDANGKVIGLVAGGTKAKRKE